MDPRRRIGMLATAWLVGSALAGPARADRIFVRNGTSIKGKAIADDAHPDQYLIFGEHGKTPIVLKRDRVARIEPEASALDDYVPRRKALDRAGVGSSGARVEYEVGLWCEEHRLRDLAAVHYEGAIRRDPAFGPAHRKLGHVESEGRWLTQAELKTARGYILHRGKWITAEEKARRDEEDAASAEQQSWVKRLAILRQAILGPVESRSRDAAAQLLAIREAAAVGPIARVFGNDPDPGLRKLAAEALGAIPGPSASAALVARLLAETEDDVRRATMDQLARSKELNVIPRLLAGLQSKSLPVVNRAAWALGNLNAVRTVPRLIQALLSTELQLVWVPSDEPGSPGSSFGNMASSPTLFGVSQRAIPILTGPAVGPGVVAYGGTSVPSTAFGGYGVSLGGVQQQGPTPKYVEVAHRNIEVHAALVKLTGQDFGFDIASWRRWSRTSYRPDPTPPRRIPQP